jgi:hypothetical protein
VEGRQIVPDTFTEDEIERLAEMEHGRWNIERLLAGWTWGESREEAAKTSPCLVPWSELPDEVKQWDLQAVARIPELLAKAGYEVYRPERDSSA